MAVTLGILVPSWDYSVEIFHTYGRSWLESKCKDIGHFSVQDIEWDQSDFSSYVSNSQKLVLCVMLPSSFLHLVFEIRGGCILPFRTSVGQLFQLTKISQRFTFTDQHVCITTSYRPSPCLQMKYVWKALACSTDARPPNLSKKKKKSLTENKKKKHQRDMQNLSPLNGRRALRVLCIDCISMTMRDGALNDE